MGVEKLTYTPSIADKYLHAVLFYEPIGSCLDTILKAIGQITAN
jgi:hypothetical protein